MRRPVWILIILVVLMIAADRLAWKLAEGEVASRIQSSQRLATTPDVSIHGFPFLTQVFGGRYTDVDVNLEDLTVEDGARVDHVQVHLTGVQVPFSALVRGHLNTIAVEGATASGVVSYPSLDAAAKASLRGDALTVQFAQGKAGALALTGTFSVGVIHLQLSGDATISASNGQLVVSIPPDALDVPHAIRTQVAALLRASYRLPALPLGLKLSKVSVGRNGVAVIATGSDLVIGASDLG